MEELISVYFHKIMQSRSHTVIILGTEKKRFAIYTEPTVGKNIQTYLAPETQIRPLTHHLINSILEGLEAKILQIVINDIEDTVYFSRIFIEQKTGEKTVVLEIDARPSDCITLALMNNIPVFCKKEVFEKILPIEE